MDATGKRVLVVDDDAVLLRAVARELRAAGWEVRTIDIRCTPQRGEYDVALLDWNPLGPEMAVRCLDVGLKFAIFTADEDVHGFPDVPIVRKPWQPGELDAALRAAINKENRSC